MYPRTVPVEHYSLAHRLDSSRAGKFRILRPGSGEVHGLRSGWVVVVNRESASLHAGCSGSKGNRNRAGGAGGESGSALVGLAEVPVRCNFLDGEIVAVAAVGESDVHGSAGCSHRLAGEVQGQQRNIRNWRQARNESST